MARSLFICPALTRRVAPPPGCPWPLHLRSQASSWPAGSAQEVHSFFASSLTSLHPSNSPFRLRHQDATVSLVFSSVSSLPPSPSPHPCPPSPTRFFPIIYLFGSPPVLLCHLCFYVVASPERQANKQTTRQTHGRFESRESGHRLTEVFFYLEFSDTWGEDMTG